ncbi:MAG: non-ribosomal peptide synthetase, partial [Pseudomonadales bacterium]|nr:non-ribosomal peptide synthetase [Pseudomonadales bacterium]
MAGGEDTSANVLDLIQKLGSKNIKLWLEEQELKFKAPKGALTKALREELLAKKTEIIAFLRDVKVGEAANEAGILPVDRRQQNEFPLSFAQQRLWFIDQFEPNSSAYNIPIALYLDGDLNINALCRAIQEIVQRHESLRTTFKSIDGEAFQLIQQMPSHNKSDTATLYWDLPLQDLTHLDEAERESVARSLAQQEIEKPFDLVSGPLLRTRLIKLADHKHALVATMHHIVSDGWSLNVLVQELAVLYDCFSTNAAALSPLQPLSLQYVDFAVWQRERLKEEELDKQLAYWKKHLLGAPPLLALPTDRPRPLVQTKNGAHVPVVLATDLVEQLRDLSHQQGATLYMTLMAGFKVLLSKYSQQQDITVGMPIAGRNRVEIEPLIGFFVNSLVTRTRFDDNPTVVELIERERVSILGAHAHQDVPFEAVVDALDL